MKFASPAMGATPSLLHLYILKTLRSDTRNNPWLQL